MANWCALHKFIYAINGGEEFEQNQTTGFQSDEQSDDGSGVAIGIMGSLSHFNLHGQSKQRMKKKNCDNN